MILDLETKFAAHDVVIAGNRLYTPLGEVKLTSGQARFVAFLLMAYPHVVSRDSMMTLLTEKAETANVLAVRRSQINPKLKDLGLRIAVVWGTGMKLEIDKTAFANVSD